jgi:hypothetical protein
MSRVEVVAVPRGSAVLGIYTRDHCPPHATCRDTSRQWTIRITFSFLDTIIGLLSVHPAQNNPGTAVIHELERAVHRNLSECRRLWWAYQQNTQEPAGPCCLKNQTVGGSVVLDAVYDPATSRLRLRSSDGFTTDRVV